MDTLGPLKLSLNMDIVEVKQYTKVLVWDRNKCPEYRGFLYMEVLIREYLFHLNIRSPPFSV